MPNKRHDINVVLDLDNTLIYSIPFEKLKKKPKWVKHFKYHYMNDDYVVFERPGLRPFLRWLFKNFNVTVWSAASPDYVEFIAKNIVEDKKKKSKRELEYVLNSENCEDSQKRYGDECIKNLQLLWDVHDLKGYGPYNTLIIDDLKMVTGFQPNNSIRVKKFISRKESVKDNELKNVKKKLNTIKKNFKNINNADFSLVDI